MYPSLQSYRIHAWKSDNSSSNMMVSLAPTKPTDDHPGFHSERNTLQSLFAFLHTATSPHLYDTLNIDLCKHYLLLSSNHNVIVFIRMKTGKKRSNELYQKKQSLQIYFKQHYFVKSWESTIYLQILRARLRDKGVLVGVTDKNKISRIHSEQRKKTITGKKQSKKF